MWSTISKLKSNITAIASDVLDAAEELELEGSSHSNSHSQSDLSLASPGNTSSAGIPSEAQADLHSNTGGAAPQVQGQAGDAAALSRGSHHFSSQQQLSWQESTQQQQPQTHYQKPNVQYSPQQYQQQPPHPGALPGSSQTGNGTGSAFYAPAQQAASSTLQWPTSKPLDASTTFHNPKDGPSQQTHHPGLMPQSSGGAPSWPAASSRPPAVHSSHQPGSAPFQPGNVGASGQTQLPGSSLPGDRPPPSLPATQSQWRGQTYAQSNSGQGEVAHAGVNGRSNSADTSNLIDLQRALEEARAELQRAQAAAAEKESKAQLEVGDLRRELEQARAQTAKAQEESAQLQRHTQNEAAQGSADNQQLVDALLRRLQEVESQAAARDASQAEQVAVLQQLREEEIEALKAQHASEIEELRGRYAGQIEGLQGQLRGEVEGSRGRYQGEIEALKEQHVKAEDALRAERDKATKDLARLKQHLLHIETEESEKAEAEALKVAEMEQRIAAQEMEILALQQNNARLASALEDRGRAEKDADDRVARELREAQGQLAALREEYAALAADRDAREEELSNLQAALGQFYAERDAKNNLASEVRAAREEAARLTRELEAVREAKGVSDTAAAAAESKAAEAEEKVAVAVARQQKWEAEVGKLRRALEESMLRLNQLSTESGFYVDRRIVVKLLLTYFERQHSKDALDLMAKMLGFTEDEKEKVNEAASRLRGGGAVVRGVLNLPGKLVGLLPKGEGGMETPGSPALRSDGTSFSDMWIDFLLKESEERDRRDRDAAERDRRDRDAAELQRRMGGAEGGTATSTGQGVTAGATAGGAAGGRGPSPGAGPGPSGSQGAGGPSAAPVSERGPGRSTAGSHGASSPPKFYTTLPPTQPRLAGTPGKPPLSYDLTAVTRSRTPSPTHLAHDVYGHGFDARRPSPGASTLGTQAGQALGGVPGALGGVPGVSGAPGVRRSLIPGLSGVAEGVSPGPTSGAPRGGRDDPSNSYRAGDSSTVAGERERESFFLPVNGVKAVHGVPRKEGDESSEDFSPVPLHGNLSGEVGSLFDTFRMVGKGKEETPLPL